MTGIRFFWKSSPREQATPQNILINEQTSFKVQTKLPFKTPVALPFMADGSLSIARLPAPATDLFHSPESFLSQTCRLPCIIFRHVLRFAWKQKRTSLLPFHASWPEPDKTAPAASRTEDNIRQDTDKPPAPLSASLFRKWTYPPAQNPWLFIRRNACAPAFPGIIRRTEDARPQRRIFKEFSSWCPFAAGTVFWPGLFEKLHYGLSTVQMMWAETKDASQQVIL